MNNPIEERFERLIAQWTNAINKPGVQMVRFHANKEEELFIQDLFEYMMALDTDQEDLVFLLTSPWTSIDLFSKTLVDELAEIIDTWNNADKSDGLPQNKIDWKPIYNAPLSNPAQLFANNISTLANVIVPQQDIIVSVLIPMPFAVKANANKWLKHLLETPLQHNIRIGIVDTSRYPIFDKIAKEKQVYTLIPNIDVNAAMEEMAAMGNPDDPQTEYREHLAKLFTAVKKRKPKAVDFHAKSCLDIAIKNVGKDANWLGQVVLIYTTLYNDQIGNKDYKRALYFADKAVESGELTIGRMEPSAAYRLHGQPLMGRGAIQHLLGNKKEAMLDYKLAAQSFLTCSDYVMHCEAVRLYATHAKQIEPKDALQQLVSSFYLIDKMPPDIITNSTYPMLALLLFNWPDRVETISDNEMAEKLRPHFGKHYVEELKRYGTVAYAKEKIYQEPVPN